MPSPKVAVVVPVHGRLPKTLRFIESFRRVEYDSYRLVIVDDASPDGTAAVLARDHPDVVVLPGDGQLWWTGGTNLGVRYALDHGFDYALTINNDTNSRPDFLARLVETAERCAPCIVGSRIHFLDQPHRVWGIGGETNWRRGDMVAVCERDADEAELLSRRANPAEVELLTGCGTLVPTACYRQIGLYDRRMFPHYHSDSELTLRAARRGWRILVDLRSVIYVDESNPTWKKSLFRLGSPMYWRPLLAMHLRYCPRRHLLSSLARQLARGLRDTLVPRRPGIRTFLRKLRDRVAPPARRAG
jgi:GT2 family glycosyltransferase